MTSNILTIGVYGFTEDHFYRALQEAGVDLFCDIRRRRGMRGSQYAFVNSIYLQQRLAALGIRYVHRLDLAPSPGARDAQQRVDADAGVAKRQRLGLSEPFVQHYTNECLTQFDSNQFLHSLGTDIHTIALFCVEAHPEACHRSLVAERLRLDLKLCVAHITPESSVPLTLR